MGIGEPARRREDLPLIQGQGQYVGDMTLPDMLHAGFVRSPLAHAHIKGVDVRPALDLPGVAAAYTARDLPELACPVEVPAFPPGLRGHGVSPLADDRARYVGEPLAVVLAEDLYVLADALDAVTLDLDPLEPTLDPEASLEGVPIWPDVPDNVALDLTVGMGDVDDAFARAEVVVEERFAFARAAPVSLETRAVLAAPGEGVYALTIWDSTQSPQIVRDSIARFLDLDAEQVRVIAPDVGGGFGPKGRVYPEEYAVALLALRLRRPVRFVATRTEDLITTGQGRGQVHHVRLAARADGTLLALDDGIVQDVGAHTQNGLPAPINTVRHLIGPYRLPALRARVLGIYTNKTPSSTLRGGGRPQGVFVMERLLDRLADRLGLDCIEVRRRNLLPPDAFPHDTGLEMPGGQQVVYDSGNFPAYVDIALRELDLPSFRERQRAGRARGEYLGVGVALFIEQSGTGSEEARAELCEDGRVRVTVGSPSQGQGHATAFAQIAAERLDLHLDSVEVVSGDTALARGQGTFASRMGQFGGNAVSAAAGELRRRILEFASEFLEIAPDDLELSEGGVGARGVPSRGLTLGEVATAAGERGISLATRSTYQPERPGAWAGGAHAVTVRVDVDTGAMEILRYVAVDDAGRVINPLIVDGQVQGGVAHGIGNALLEACEFGPEGQPLTATLADYAIPQAGSVPAVEIHHVETPSPFNPLGVKGVGESGVIGSLPAIAAAVEDALAPFGVTICSLPIRVEWIAEQVRAHSAG